MTDQTSEIIAMAWADEVPFSAIKNQFGLSESEVIVLMRSALKPSSFKLWRKRVTGRKTKHFGTKDDNAGSLGDKAE